MGRVMAIGGGDLHSTEALNRVAVRLSGKERPHVLFLGTASMDADAYYGFFRPAFQKLHCSVKRLSLTKGEPEAAQIDARLDWADLIYVGGGDTKTMIEVWHRFGLVEKLKEIYAQDRAVLAGLSAGAICWFEAGYSDWESFSGKEDWRFQIVEGMLGFFHGCVCPHYNEEGRSTFDAAIEESAYGGLALENETAFLEIDGESFLLGARPDAKAWTFTRNGSRMIKRECQVIPCSAFERREI